MPMLAVVAKQMSKMPTNEIEQITIINLFFSYDST